MKKVIKVIIDNMNGREQLQVIVIKAHNVKINQLKSNNQIIK